MLTSFECCRKLSPTIHPDVDRTQRHDRWGAVNGRNEKHLSPADLAEREGVSVQTVYCWNSDGSGPVYLKVGRHARYRLADVIAWENERLVARGGDAA